MWYDLIEQQARWWRAWRAATAWTGALGDATAAACCADLLEPMLGWQDGMPPFEIDTIVLKGRAVGIDSTVAACMPFCALRRFARRNARRAILLCVPLAGHAAVMMRDTVEALLEDGDVFVTEWANARDVPLDAGRFGLDEYVAMLDGFVGWLLTGTRPVHVVAVCQAAVPGLGAIALRAQRGAPIPASLTLIGGPLDARIHPSALGIAACSHSLAWCDSNLIDVVPQGFAGRGRKVFPAYLQGAEIAFVYPHRYLEMAQRCRSAASSGDARAYEGARRALNEYAALRDMPAEYFLDTVDSVFQRASLAQGDWRVGGVRVDPTALCDLDLLTVEGGRDSVTGAGQTHAALAMCGGRPGRQRMRLDVEDCDHYGLFTGPRWRGEVHHALRARFAHAELARAARAVPDPLDRPIDADSSGIGRSCAR